MKLVMLHPTTTTIGKQGEPEIIIIVETDWQWETHAHSWIIIYDELIAFFWQQLCIIVCISHLDAKYTPDVVSTYIPPIFYLFFSQFITLYCSQAIVLKSQNTYEA